MYKSLTSFVINVYSHMSLFRLKVSIKKQKNTPTTEFFLCDRGTVFRSTFSEGIHI